MSLINDNALLADRTIALAHAATTDSLKITDTFGRYADEHFKGNSNQPVYMKVQKPTLQVREYELYNDREQPIKMDFEEEQLVELKVQKRRIYSATGLRDEVADFDLNGNYGELIYRQAMAMSNHFERSARAMLETAPYEYVKYVDYSEAAIKKAIAINQDVLYNAMVEARTALSLMSSPLENTRIYAVAGSNWVSAMRKNQKLVLVTGDNQPSAFANAIVGEYAGIQVIEDHNINPDTLYLYTSEAFLLWSAAPGVPAGAVRGSQLHDGNLAMTWIQDYDSAFVLGRSLLWSYTAFGNTLDFVSAANNRGGQTISEDRYFIRGVKLVLGSGVDIAPGNGKGGTAGADPNSILAKRYNRVLVNEQENKTVFADLTYQNVVSGNVKAGSAGALTINDKAKRTRQTKKAEVEKTPPEIPGEEH